MFFIENRVIDVVFEQCRSRRDILLLKRLYAFESGSSMECWLHMICQIELSCIFELPSVPNLSCQEDGTGIAQFCYELNNTAALCSQGSQIFFPTSAIPYPFVRFLYTIWKTELFIANQYSVVRPWFPDWICYNTSACDTRPWDKNYTVIIVQGYHCYRLFEFAFFSRISRHPGIIQATVTLTMLQKAFSHCSHSLPHPDLYQCPSGLQISHYRLMDGFSDCFPSDADEQMYNPPSCTYNLTNRFKCQTFAGGAHICIPKRLVRDGDSDCGESLDELFPVGCTYEYDCQFLRDFDSSKSSYPFIYGEFCNGIQINFDWEYKLYDVDETDCDLWPCEARVHRCNGVWNRLNGCDELNCHGSVSTYLAQMVGNCSIDEHYCIQFNQTKLSCLPVTRAGDGVMDCLFGMDEQITPTIIMSETIFSGRNVTKRKVGPCWRTTKDFRGIGYDKICDRKSDCPLKDDELLCAWHLNSACSNNHFTCENGTCVPKLKRCNGEIDCWPKGEDEWACELGKLHRASMDRYRPFTLAGFDTEPDEERTESSTVRTDDLQSKQERIVFFNDTYAIFYCHRGILLRSRDGNNMCLCPPSYYGNRCQFQSERLAVTFRTQMFSVSDQNAIYHLVFLLLDQHHRVITVESIVHMPSKQSTMKHLIYLLYPRHSVHGLNDNMVIQIEAYPITFTGVQSASFVWYYRVPFPFLPVNLLAVKLDLESKQLNKALCLQLGCIHGLCTSYVNIRNKHFCACHHGWTGLTCSERLIIDPCIQLKCDPSYSKCVAHGDRAICLCSLGRIGHNCRVPYNGCNGVLCENGGHCVSLDERALQTACLCLNDYFGPACQFKTAKLTIHIPQTIEFIPALIAHFLHTPETIPGTLPHRKMYFLRNIHPGTEMTIRDRQQQFLPPIIILQTFLDLSSHYGSYYLLSLMSSNRTSLTKTLPFDKRCVHVSERLNATIMNFTWTKRVKLYHHYFQDVRCFFDEVYMCLVDRFQLIECLNFNHNVTDCTDRNYCENGGRCLQDTQTGYLQFVCVCPECHYGLFCQLTMTQYSLTLDTMIGQEIMTDVSLSGQKPMIKITLALVIIMLVVGMTSNICSTLTFSHAHIRNVGCGYYLLVLSIANQITLSVFFVASFIF